MRENNNQTMILQISPIKGIHTARLMHIKAKKGQVTQETVESLVGHKNRV